MKQLLIKIISYYSKLKYRFSSRVEFGKGVIANTRLRISGPGKVIIGDDVNLWSFAEPVELQTYSKDAVIRIGNGCRLNGTTIQARELVEVGEDCMLASVIIMDNDFHHVDPVRRRDKSEIPCRPVRIGRNVWIAGQAAVLKGVTIGDNSVVGFRAVVTKEVPANVVVAGNSAKVVKEF